MASTELDLPLLPSADQIRRREFATIRRGYDPDQVREYLNQISVQVEMLEQELREARLAASAQDRVVTVAEPAPDADGDHYERFAGKVADVLRAADEHAERVVQDAREEAGRALTEARTETDRIRVDAQARAEEARQQGSEVLLNARAEAERMLSTLSARRETLVEQLAQMQTRLLGVARELEAAIDEPEDVTVSDGEVRVEFPEPSKDTREFDLLRAAVEEPSSVDEDRDDIETPRAEKVATSPEQIDPRYEDLWISHEAVEIDLGDLTLGETDGIAEGD